jgi:hypothetical protein
MKGPLRRAFFIGRAKKKSKRVAQQFSTNCAQFHAYACAILPNRNAYRDSRYECRIKNEECMGGFELWMQCRIPSSAIAISLQEGRRILAQGRGCAISQVLQPLYN